MADPPEDDSGCDSLNETDSPGEDSDTLVFHTKLVKEAGVTKLTHLLTGEIVALPDNPLGYDLSKTEKPLMVLLADGTEYKAVKDIFEQSFVF